MAKAVGGLDAIEARGTLRIIVRRSEATFLPRTGMPWLSDIENAEAFARSLGVEPVFVLVEAYDQLVPALREGRGDLVAAQLTITEERKKWVDFARSTLGVEEIVVGKKGAPGLPTSMEGLAGRQVLVRPSSSYASSLAELSREKGIEVEIVEAEEHLDTATIVDTITDGAGERLTVVDSHLLAAIEQYNDRIARLFVLAQKSEIAWAVRKDNPELRAALDRFFIKRALTGRAQVRWTGDLGEIIQRGVLRVLTRNNAASYFLHRGQARGFDYELTKMIAEELDVRHEMVVVPSHKHLIPWLLEGRGDIIAAQMTVTPSRARKVVFSEPYLFTQEMLVKKKTAAGPKSVDELGGRTVTVRPSSSYRTTLERIKKRGIAVEFGDVDENVETAVLIGRVAEGDIALTVADRHLLDVEVVYGVDAEAAFALDDADKPIAFGVRPGERRLKAFLDGFVKRHYRGLEYNILKRRYFANQRTIRRFKAERVAKSGRLSKFDDVIKKYSSRYGFDWRLMAAQAYVESRFDPKATSWVGAQGLFQVLPRTGATMGFTRLEEPEYGVHAGIKYMARLLDRFDPKLPFPERVRMALAAYNVGLGHVHDARRLAARMNLDDSKWFGNVEKAMLLLSQPKYARRARHGYCRGQQPVKYVAHIQSLYDQYVQILKE